MSVHPIIANKDTIMYIILSMATIVSRCLLVIAGFLPRADGAEYGCGYCDDYFDYNFPVGDVEFHGLIVLRFVFVCLSFIPL